jgi:hypothetical protein
LNTDGFSNPKADGYFRLAVSGTNLILNFTPLEAVADSLTRSNSSATQISAASLIVNDVGTGLSITAISATSANGGQIELGGGVVYYNPPTNNLSIASDTFTYTVTDTNGKTSTGTVTVTTAGGQTQFRTLGMQAAGHGKFYGIPNVGYRIEHTDSLSPEDWQTLTTVGVNGIITTDNSGLGIFDDPEDPMPSERYYRIVAP